MVSNQTLRRLAMGDGEIEDYVDASVEEMARELLERRGAVVVPTSPLKHRKN